MQTHPWCAEQLLLLRSEQDFDGETQAKLAAHGGKKVKGRLHS